jgi:hypothetical protein
MRNKKIAFFIFFVIFCIDKSNAQDKPSHKFGDVTLADFKQSEVKFDSGANAVILSDVGSTKFEGNSKGSFTLIFTRYMRVKIINKNGFDVGNYELLLFHDKTGDFEKLTNIRGSTFNQENGIIKETQLDQKSIYSSKYNKDIDTRKFSMPALQEGSVYDLEYTIKSPFSEHLRSWEFQGKYPVLWSEYEVTIPPPFHYVMRIRGDDHFEVNTAKLISQQFSIRVDNGVSSDDMYNLSGQSVYRRWVKKNIPALHEEPYTTTLKNYNSQVIFQLNYFQWTNQAEKQDFLSTWPSAAKDLLKAEYFGADLGSENYWLADELKSITGDASTEEEKTYRIYCFVRDNFKTAGAEGYNKESQYIDNTLKDVFKKREGNVAEINLLLTAMLRKEGISADPMILSTRQHGIPSPDYPLIEEYNYVVCFARPGNKEMMLDATQPLIGFGTLPFYCYNGTGHVINAENPMAVSLSADSINESSVTRVIIINDEKGKPTGAYEETMGKNGSYETRSEIRNSSLKDYQIKLQTRAGSDVTIENFGIDSLKQYEFPLSMHYDFELKDFSSSDILYFNPMMGEGYKTNPFKSAERHYPVEMPYKIDETYLLTMDIPQGYQVDELPKSAHVAYNDNEGLFEYLIQMDKNTLQMRVRLKFNKAFFGVEEYTVLRNFFALVVKKESEQVVFKKVK